MRDPNASFEPPPIDPSRIFRLPGADLVSAAWGNPQPGAGLPTRSDKAKTVSGAMLAIGVALLMFVPLGGALFLVAGGLGLTIASEAPVSPPTDP